MFFTEESIYLAIVVSAVKTVGTSVKVEWSTTLATSTLPLDGVSLIFFHEEYQQAILKENCATRSEGTMMVVHSYRVGRWSDPYLDIFY